MTHQEVNMDYDINPLTNVGLAQVARHDGGDLPLTLPRHTIQSWRDGPGNRMGVWLEGGGKIELQFCSYGDLSDFHVWAVLSGDNPEDREELREEMATAAREEEERKSEEAPLPVSPMTTARILDLRSSTNPGIDKMVTWGKSITGIPDFLPVRNVSTWGRPSKDALAQYPWDIEAALSIETLAGREITLLFTSPAEQARFVADLAQKVSAL